MAHEQLGALALYEAMYTSEPRRFAIPTTSDAPTWDEWRATFRPRLRERLGALPSEQAPVSVTAAAPTVHAGYQRTYLEFESAPGVTVPAWLLIPVGLTSPAPAVIAVHGYGADEIVGIKADGTERTEPQGYHQDFAIALCRRGMVMIAPELRGFGRRREPQDQIGDPASSSCHALAWWAIMSASRYWAAGWRMRYRRSTCSSHCPRSTRTGLGSWAAPAVKRSQCLRRRWSRGCGPQ